MMDEFDAVAKNAAQLDKIYDTPTTNALIVAVAQLRERLEREGLLHQPTEEELDAHYQSIAKPYGGAL